jgi:pimeloyl-ACP methyl ester carboxylesterase
MSTWILLRGLTREGRHWGTFPEQLRVETAFNGGTDAHGITLIDLPGNGRENALNAPLDVADMVQFVRSRAAEAGLLPPYRLVAMSLGGMVATGWAQRYPEEIDRLVLINTSMRPFSAMSERLRPSVWPALIRAAASWADPLKCETIIHDLTCNRLDTQAGDIAAWAAIRRSAPVSAANGLRQLWAAARFRAGNHAPACPTLLLSSKADRLVNPVCSARIAARWGVAHAVHASAGHDLPHDDPVWTGKAIGDWLRTLQRLADEPPIASDGRAVL